MRIVSYWYWKITKTFYRWKKEEGKVLIQLKIFKKVSIKKRETAIWQGLWGVRME